MAAANHPFIQIENGNDAPIRALGETALLERIRSWLGPVAPRAPIGMGDDCAVIESLPNRVQLLTTDSVSYGQHFDDKVRAEDAGAKLIKRNLSDIAAMGGEPGPALLNLLCGPDLSVPWLERFVAGVRECCQRHALTIVGGDISQLAPGNFSAALTLTGTCIEKPLLRSTAGVGDGIFLTGKIGGSILKKHYGFEPRLKEGQWLARRAAVTSMMDLTDGLGKDLPQLVPVDCAAALHLDKLPVSEDARICAAKSGRSIESHAFCDGEDYELLFTVSADCDFEEFQREWRSTFPGLELAQIGSIVAPAARGRLVDASTGEALPWKHGFEHFKSG